MSQNHQTGGRVVLLETALSHLVERVGGDELDRDTNGMNLNSKESLLKDCVFHLNSALHAARAVVISSSVNLLSAGFP